MTIFIGVTGHQNLSPSTRRFVRRALDAELEGLIPLVGITSLARGADQIFADCVLGVGGELTVILPASGYESTFAASEDLTTYHRLLGSAIETITLPFGRPSEEAYMAAGKAIVERSNLLLAVWDGQPAGGLGGTADIVAYATQRGVATKVIWPTGAVRR